MWSVRLGVWRDSHTTDCRSVLQRVAACCSVLQCVAVCCSVLQCVAVWSDSHTTDHVMTRVWGDSFM